MQRKVLFFCRIILAMASPVFYTKFYGEGPAVGVVPVEDISPHIFSYLLR